MIHYIIFVKLKYSKRGIAKMLSTLLCHYKSNMTETLNGLFFSWAGTVYI